MKKIFLIMSLFVFSGLYAADAQQKYINDLLGYLSSENQRLNLENSELRQANQGISDAYYNCDSQVTSLENTINRVVTAMNLNGESGLMQFLADVES